MEMIVMIMVMMIEMMMMVMMMVMVVVVMMMVMMGWSCTFHPALADDTSNRDHIFRLSALQIEKPNGILPRLVLRRWPQRL